MITLLSLVLKLLYINSGVKMNTLTTKQVKNVSKNNNPEGAGGFGEHPEHRSNGRWSKENSYVYWLNFFKNLTLSEFKN
jgi:hypothetical protein